MSSEVPLLTFSELDEIARNIQIDYCLGKVMSFDSAFARAVEQAVRAQWAAEVAAKDAEIAGLRELANQHQTRFSMVVAAHTERDSAQAEAKRLRELLAAVLDLVPMREEFHYLDRGIGTKTASGVTLLSARAAVQPGAHHVE